MTYYLVLVLLSNLTYVAVSSLFGLFSLLGYVLPLRTYSHLDSRISITVLDLSMSKTLCASCILAFLQNAVHNFHRPFIVHRGDLSL
ncbi:hypothetical protein GDO81_023720 [Engystomops pustulosus]|uniref:Uncharacterized protein n=1 Tax=Engystomops pustulosus TaxID=76066 RepID=A0AAV6ZTA8_ENGPU|nr:hypothetical protein GDO81_023720 [Engystomops pustulosus]